MLIVIVIACAFILIPWLAYRWLFGSEEKDRPEEDYQELTDRGHVKDWEEIVKRLPETNSTIIQSAYALDCALNFKRPFICWIPADLIAKYVQETGEIPVLEDGTISEEFGLWLDQVACGESNVPIWFTKLPEDLKTLPFNELAKQIASKRGNKVLHVISTGLNTSFSAPATEE